MQDLTQDLWRAQLEGDDNAVILDVRTDLEVEEGYIPNSKHMDVQNPPVFMEIAQELDSGKNYYVYCRSGSRSTQACMILGSLGIGNTYNLLGGFEEWTGEITQ